MTKTIIIAATALLVTVAAGCKTSKKQAIEVTPTDGTVQMVRPTGSAPVSMLPRAHVYKTNGDYNDYVPVTLNAARTQIVSYPATSDVVGQTPIAVGDGWLLDRRGVGTNSAFLDYTYAQYAALPQTPSIEQLKQHIIPDARVTEVSQLDMTLQQALSDLPAVRKAVKKLSK